MPGARFASLGLFGEVGSLMSAAKKKRRDGDTYLTYSKTITEEAGDALWYLANAALRLKLEFGDVAARAGLISPSQSPKTATFKSLMVPTDHGNNAIDLERQLLQLGGTVGSLVIAIAADNELAPEAMTSLFADVLYNLATISHFADVRLNDAIAVNMAKIASRWPESKRYGDSYDDDYDIDERLPLILSMRFRVRVLSGKTYIVQSWNGVNIGDRITDNRQTEDYYRYHDIFHLAFAAVLGWSPVLRSLLRLKRKSRPDVDENQDGARALVIEEAIVAWIFNHASAEHNIKSNYKVDYDLLKSIQILVSGYEVESRALWQWEEAISQAFRIFDQIIVTRQGTVTINLVDHAITFENEASIA